MMFKFKLSRKKKITLTEDQAREMYSKLRGVFEVQQKVIPMPYAVQDDVMMGGDPGDAPKQEQNRLGFHD